MSEKSEEACGPAGDSTRAVMACVKSLEEDLASAQDKFLRLAADFDNFKKRSAQEADRRATAQKSGFMRELLPVIDNLERALTVDPSASPDQLRAGVDMTFQQLHQLLRRLSILYGTRRCGCVTTPLCQTTPCSKFISRVTIIGEARSFAPPSS
jgi:molecular chaperone GrpE (heat shock protein)